MCADLCTLEQKQLEIGIASGNTTVSAEHELFILIVDLYFRVLFSEIKLSHQENLQAFHGHQHPINYIPIVPAVKVQVL